VGCWLAPPESPENSNPRSRAHRPNARHASPPERSYAARSHPPREKPIRPTTPLSPARPTHPTRSEVHTPPPGESQARLAAPVESCRNAPTPLRSRNPIRRSRLSLDSSDTPFGQIRTSLVRKKTNSPNPLAAEPNRSSAPSARRPAHMHSPRWPRSKEVAAALAETRS